MRGQVVRTRGGNIGRGIKGLRRVQSGQSEEEVLDWTVRSDRTGMGRGRDNSGACMHTHPCLAACLPRKQQEAVAAAVLIPVARRERAIA
ncbi:unnamed protein product [Brugia pahangi]|uniref:Uncharacterized protein n=1 Tax=Brugia pahangi TaxID=6280 RepID=A0A0N4T0F8_BRUPA|nr:unnamed protein product [Brugia pahangi]